MKVLSTNRPEQVFDRHDLVENLPLGRRRQHGGVRFDQPKSRIKRRNICGFGHGQISRKRAGLIEGNDYTRSSDLAIALTIEGCAFIPPYADPGVGFSFFSRCGIYPTF